MDSSVTSDEAIDDGVRPPTMIVSVLQLNCEVLLRFRGLLVSYNSRFAHLRDLKSACMKAASVTNADAW